MKIYLRLLKYVSTYSFYLAISILGFLIFASAQPVFAVLLKFFVDGLYDPALQPLAGMPVLGSAPILYVVPGLVVAIAIWQGVGTYLGNVFIARVSLGVVRDLRIELFKKFLVLPNSYFDHQNSGHLVSRIIYNVEQVTGAATDAVKVVIREGLTIVFLFGYLFWSNWKLTLVMAAVLPVVGLLVQRANRRFRTQSTHIQESMGDITHIASETIQGYRAVRSFGGERYEESRFKGAAENSLKRQLRMVKTAGKFTPMLQIVIYTAMALLFFLVIALRGDATAGDLVAYITAAGLMPKPARQLSEISATIQRGLAAAQSVFEQLDEPAELDQGSHTVARAEGKITVEGLGFKYPGSKKQVLSNISFQAEPGQMIALVGHSGSGKSTIASLIPRFYSGWQGQIKLDGVAVQDWNLKNLRQQIALVTQTTILFNDTIAKNIAYGDLAGASMEEIKAAADGAYATDFIMQLPKGFDTLVGEDGVLLSGGQRQRIAIARAILKNAPVLILDEATSALDTESERHIQLALEAATQGRTTLVIAHRLSTIERADQILVLDGGAVVERGTHAELMQLGGVYCSLHAMQFTKQKNEAS
jgi:ATP-binding cassette, subfamily B, bacterial MsbA